MVCRVDGDELLESDVESRGGCLEMSEVENIWDFIGGLNAE